ncbi:T9SS type A sorting domain-containing protein [Marivirga sp. S37H4]|uniref:T9SS type A sorting domain-containing protein n=1 Tax=Marivirga aurantiaca TaxID=2802615 RepID=A0A935C5K1_9BACT|nr:T9SS type A sorting domain-containing protein [Marivirga aurantiaca]MBK6263859.1 T9SS type A sorting domain-containing protein [Marivirga aurantiaca]
MASQKLATDPPFDLVGSSSSGLPLAYFTSDESVISISGNRATIKKAGIVQVTAKQEGDDIFDEATAVSRSLTITKAPQDISFTLASQKLATDPPFDLVGSSSSGLPLTYFTSDESVISISGNSATIKKAGTVQITAKQVGDDIYDEAIPVVQNLEVHKVQQNIVFDLPSKKYGDPDFALDARSDAGISITYSIDNNSAVNLINGNMIRIKSVGNTNITATAESTSIYYEASVTKNLEISAILGIEERALDKSIIYPNPADRVIVIDLAEFTNSTVTISVYDMYGRDRHMITTTATERIPLDISDFQSGIYFVKIIHKNETNILKFIKR